MYGQATQDGCSLALFTSPTWQPVPASLTLYSYHMIDLPVYLHQAPISDCFYQRDSEGRASLLVSVVTNESTWCNSPYKWHTPLPSTHLEWSQPPHPAHHLPYMVRCHFRTLFQMCKLPYPLNHWCLCCWLPAFFFLEAGQAHALQACGVQPNITNIK